MAKRTEAGNRAVRRFQSRQALAWAWIKLHRPEIADLIDKEVLQKYPRLQRQRDRRSSVTLPESLR